MAELMDRVLHLSGEYPDCFNGKHNSPVVDRLVTALSEAAPQWVVSINRSADPRRVGAVEESPRHLAVRYFGLPYGMGHRWSMRRLAATVGAWMQRSDIRPTLIIGHKFTVEGLVAQQLARRFGCAYALGFMPTTDDKLWRGLPWCRRAFEAVAAGACAWVFPTPVTARRFLPRLSPAPSCVRVIPFISGVRGEAPAMCLTGDSRTLLTVFNFSNLRYKNFARLVAAVMHLRAQGLAVTLDVAGHGGPEDVARVQRIVQRHRAADAVRCIGHVDSSRMRETMARYGAMALPSCPESFGLVYLEAIAAGIPVLSSRGYALDGYFTAGYPGVKVDPKSVPAIAAGIRELVEARAKFAAAFANIGPEWQRFTRAHIQAAYLDVLRAARNEGT
jgi:glycosyltransferase involved in cell wall biosynthesis